MIKPRISLAARPAVKTLGFSLIELMIAMVAGLIVIGSVTAFAVASIESNVQNTISTRLMQELRTTMSLVTREIRRAGFDQRAHEGIARGAAFVSPFAPIALVPGPEAGECIVFAYDATGGTAGALDAGEIKGLRRSVGAGGNGVIQYHPGAGGTPNCANDAGWEDITDPFAVDVTFFRLAHANAAPAPVVAPLTAPLWVRELDVQLAGRLVNEPDVVRALDSRVRIRADCIRIALDDCLSVPGAAPTPPPAPPGP